MRKLNQPFSSVYGPIVKKTKISHLNIQWPQNLSLYLERCKVKYIFQDKEKDFYCKKKSAGYVVS